MADNTRMKELQAEVKRNAEALELAQSHLKVHMDRFEAANNNRFERLEALNASTESKLTQITETLEALLLRRVSPGPHHGASNSGKQPFQVRNVKLEFPRFDGKKVFDWIFKAEQFFDYYDTPDMDRITIASVHLDQDVVPWFQMMQRNQPFQSWQMFTRALELDFDPYVYDCPRATLFKLAQTNSVNEYYIEFTSLANRVYGLSNDALIHCFVSGLQSDIKRDVMIHSPNSIVKAVALVKVYEEK